MYKQYNLKSHLKIKLAYACLIYSTILSNPYAEYISGGVVSTEVKQSYESFLDKIKTNNFIAKNIIKTNPLPNFELRKISEKVIKVYPQLKCGGKLPHFNFIYVDETFFNKLNEQEKTFFWATCILTDPISIYKLQGIIKKLFASVAFAPACILLSESFISKDPLKNGLAKGAISAASLLPLAYYYAKFLIFIGGFSVLEFQIDSLIVEHLNCRDGAVSILLSKFKEILVSIQQDNIKDSNKLKEVVDQLNQISTRIQNLNRIKTNKQ